LCSFSKQDVAFEHLNDNKSDPDHPDHSDYPDYPGHIDIAEFFQFNLFSSELSIIFCICYS